MSYRVTKAQRMMAAAEAALAGEHWESVVSRAYYAVYHMVVEVLAEKRGVDVGKRQHAQVVNAFQNAFSKRGYLFTAEQGRSLRRLLDDRHEADCDDVTWTGKRALRSVDGARRLYHSISSELRR